MIARSVRRVQALLACFGSLASVSAAWADPRDDLQFLMSLQGSWQRHCYPSSDGATRIYREDTLKVSYTEFNFLTKVFTDERCLRERTHYSAKVPFVLTGEYAPYPALANSEITAPKRVYAINFFPDPATPSLLRLPELNIVAIESLNLYLGRDFSGESAQGERLTKVDIRAPFIRF